MPSPSPTISSESTEELLEKKLASIRKSKQIEEEKKAAAKLGFHYVTLIGHPIATTALSVVPKSQADSLKTVCYFKDATGLKLASERPQNEAVQALGKALKAQYDLPVEIYATDQDDIVFALKEYEYLPHIREIGSISINENEIESFSEEISDFRKIKEKALNTSLSNFLNLILAAAIKINASDIHFQPEESAVTLRLRVDGVLHDIFELPRDQYIQVKKRIKLISKIKINVENQPQDGTFMITLRDKKIDLRVSVMPTNYGESVVMRILNPQTIELEFKSLGVVGGALITLEESIKKPTGMILACGPTGSGKTTTLYAVLKKLNVEGTQIITIEDPIEYKLKGILQTPADKKLGFAGGLRAILRQDPDMIMVGEIRDLDTAETAINAALTGHLVISTLHTNNAAGAIPRFLAMGVKSYLLAPSLNIIIGQRLVRRLCDQCKKSTELDPETYKRVKQKLSLLPQEELKDASFDKLAFYNAKGCNACHGLGLKGRVGIFEVLKIDEEIIAAIQKGELTEYKIFELAQKQGMVTIIQDGLLKALQGITTVEEVLRVAG